MKLLLLELCGGVGPGGPIGFNPLSHNLANVSFQVQVKRKVYTRIKTRALDKIRLVKDNNDRA